MAWFGLGKKKEDAKRLSNAHEMGKRFGAAAADGMNEFFAARFGHVGPGYVGVLREQLQLSLSREDHSPALLARGEYDVFMGNVRELKPEMRAALNLAMIDWAETPGDPQIEELVKAMIEQKLSLFESEMQVLAMGELMAVGDALIAADNAWRKAFPEQAKLEPLPT